MSSTSMASMASAAHSVHDDGAPDAGFSSSRHLITAEASQRKAFLIDKWRKRIRGCVSSGKNAISHWSRLLNLRRMIAGEREDIDTWLEFATLCRHSSNLPLAQRVLGIEMEENPLETLENFVPTGGAMLPPGIQMLPYQSSFPSPIQSFVRPTSGYGSYGNLNTLDSHGDLLSPRPVDLHVLTVDCRIEFEKLVLQWSLGKKVYSSKQLAKLVQQLNGITTNQSFELATIHLKCLLKLGSWKIRLLTPGVAVDSKTRGEIIQIYSQATHVNPKSYQAWHEWGLANYHAVQERGDRGGMTGSGLMSQSESVALLQRRLRRPSIPVEHILTYINNSLKGFFHAISLGTSKSCARVMQDMLCILNFWFKYGEHHDVSLNLKEGLELVPIDSWLGVLPQLIARIHHEGDHGRELLHELLENLGNRHAQALMYPLSVALQSPRMDRKVAAESLLTKMRQHSATLIEQSVLVSQELIRIAILWDEEWYTTLEDASKLYFGDGNVQGMLEMLVPLHEKINLGPKTNSDSNFLQTYGNELTQAYHCLQQYQQIIMMNNMTIPLLGAQPNIRLPGVSMTPQETCLAQAWEYYIPIFKRIHPHLRQVTTHHLINVSPLLYSASNLDLAVPGTYTLHGEAVKIQSFRSIINVIPSKQLPRKIRIVGHNSLEYIFLLKGHEDLRQDERVMQLFGLVNAMLENDRRTDDHNLSIQRYAVVPLSPNVGLVGWVPRGDTLHDLIRSYRERKKIILDVEHRLMSQLAPPKLYESLTLIQKLEVFEFALNSTSGEDLHKIIWYNSLSCESWIMRRSQYTKSLAVMSVVGYVLGLGDRHPSNLMLERQSCKILHIDFGDCFEVAMHRDKFPEKIPFRLTRMLVLAMEVSGIEGTFRITCERVMKVMRENRESLIAVLEAFVHDPLISWRLLNPNK
jgi:serine/threonine-protein kinase mTOR